MRIIVPLATPFDDRGARSARRLMEAVNEKGDLPLARRIAFEEILPIVELLKKTSNPTGTIKAGIRIRGIDVGAPRAPGRDLLPEELRELSEILSRLS